MKSHLAKVSLALLSAAFLLGCQEQGSGPVGPEGPQFDKPNNAICPPGVVVENGHCHGDDTKVTWRFADLTAHRGVTVNASTLLSTCPGTPGAKLSNPTVEWKDGNEDEFVADGENEHCVTVTPFRTDGFPVTLTNDAHLIVATKKGSTTVTVQFLIQNIGGVDGIQYRTDRFTIVPAEGFTGFTGANSTLHLHATDVHIYRLKGHTGGPKVEDVGTINIGDIVYH